MFGIFRPPVFTDPERTRKAAVVSHLAWGWLLIVTLHRAALIALHPETFWHSLGLALAFYTAGAACLLFNRKNMIGAATFTLLSALYGITIVSAWVADGMLSDAIDIFPVFAFMTVILLGDRAGWIAGGVCAFTGLVLVWAEKLNWLPAPLVAQSAFTSWINSMFLVAMLLLISSRSVAPLLRTLNSSQAQLEELQSAQSALRASEQKYRGLYESMIDAFAVVGLDGRFLEANQTFQNLVGYTMDELSRMTCHDLTLKCYHEAEDRIVREQVMVRGYSVVFEKEYRHHDGHHVPVELTLSLLRDAAGKPGGMWAIVRGTGPRKRAEAAIRDAQSKLAAALESMTDAVFISDVNGTFTEFNAAFATFHRFKNKLECKLALADYPAILEVNLMDGEVLPLDKWAVPRALRGETVGHAVYKLRRKDTGEAWVGSFSFAPIRDAQGSIVGSVVVGRDVTARKRDEEALRTNEERLRHLIDSTRDWTWEVNAAGVYTYVSSRCRDILGYAPDELVGRTPFDLMPPAEAARVRAVFDAIVAEKMPLYAFENTNRHKDGRTVILETNGVPILDKQGNLLGYRGMDSDITERKCAEEALRASEERFRSLFETMTEGVAIHELVCDAGGVAVDYRIVEVNPAFALHTGIATARARGNLASEVYRVSPPPFLDVYAQVARTGKSCRLDADFPPLRKCFEVSAFTPRPGWFITVFTDITERNRAEEALRESEARLRNLADNLPTGLVFQLDTGINGEIRRLTYASAGVEALHGVSIESALNDVRIVYGQFVDEDLALVLKREAASIATMTPFSVEARIRKPNGEIRWGLFMSAPRKAPNGHVLWDGLELDITERKHLEERLLQSQKMDAIGQLAGGVAHDFNNMLAGILGFAELLIERLDDPKLLRYAENIRSAATRSGELTRKLLAFARKGNFQSQPVDIHKLIDETREMLSRSIDKRIEIRTVYKAAKPNLLGDHALLVNALLNLGVNARDAMPLGGTLTFETETLDLDERPVAASSADLRPGRFVRISVSDTGCGMSGEVKRHLFEPFFTTKPIGKGTGMGLAAVYGIVKQHGGSIGVYSEIGHGTTFKILLPLTPPEQSAAAAPVETARPAFSRRLRILLVEDEPLLREMAVMLLTDAGHDVVEAADGREAVRLYESEWPRINVVVLDMIMPNMGGRDTFTALKKINPTVRALLASGFSAEGEAQAILADGVLGFVQKPFRQNELLKAIEQVAEGQRVGSGHSPESPDVNGGVA